MYEIIRAFVINYWSYIVGAGSIAINIIQEFRVNILINKLAKTQENLVTTSASLSKALHSVQQKDEALDKKQREVAVWQEKVRTIRSALEAQSQLWYTHPGKKPEFLSSFINSLAPLVIMIANLKGGVGKTTLTANLATALANKYGLKILIIDLDYQGSLSNMLRLALASRSTSAVFELSALSNVDKLFSQDYEAGSLDKLIVSLEGLIPGSALIPAFYTFEQIENRLMAEWLLQSSNRDTRFILHNFLQKEKLSPRFDVVLIDAPPRLTTGTINALATSKFVLVPTVLDNLSAEAVKYFLDRCADVRSHLNPDLRLLGVAATMTQGIALNATEQKVRADVCRWVEQAKIPGPFQSCTDATIEERLNSNRAAVFGQNIPHKARIAHKAGHDIAYYRVAQRPDPGIAQFFDLLAEQVRGRLTI